MGGRVARRSGTWLARAGVSIALVGCGGGATGSHRVDRFDADQAWSLIRLQVGFGQRPAGSPQLRRLATVLRQRMPNGHFEPVPGEPRLRNVVGSVSGALPALVIGAHYDTLTAPRGFVGANNGAAGSAIVVQLAREAQRMHRPAGAPALRFVLFDGEEPPGGTPEEDPNFVADSLRGSKAYVAAHPRQTRAMILLDYVANKGLQLPREGSSTPELWSRLRAGAARAGTEAFFPLGSQVTIFDDHTPFLQSGVPAIDLIDWRYPGHSISDRLTRLSPRSVDAVGETVLELIRELDH
jgi:hypothetical protein